MNWYILPIGAVLDLFNQFNSAPDVHKDTSGNNENIEIIASYTDDEELVERAS